MKKKRTTNTLCIISLCIMCNLTGCNNGIVSEIEADKSKIPVTININSVVWNSIQSTNQTNASVSKTVIPFSDGMLTATLESSQNIQTRTPLDMGVDYAINVYTDSLSESSLVCSKSYTVGKIVPVFLLSPGSTYLFVCYSFNNTNEYNDALLGTGCFGWDYGDDTTKPNLIITRDVLYGKKSAMITESDNHISIELTHVFSQITVVVESSNGKPITACSGDFSPVYSSYISVIDGKQANSSFLGDPFPIIWSSLGTSTIASTPFLIYQAPRAEENMVRLSSITINGITYSDIVFKFPKTIWQAGYKYKIRLKLRDLVPKPVPNAIDLNKALVYWAPGNLIYADGTYSFAPTQEYYSGRSNGGDYWNWCVLDPTDYLNYGSSYNSSVDPCQKVSPAGTWRMPTKDEFNALIELGSVSGTKNGIGGKYFGTTDAEIANANPNNYVFLPAASYRSGDYYYVNLSMSYYWSATLYDTTKAYMLEFCNTYSRIDYYYTTDFGRSVRCVSGK